MEKMFLLLAIGIATVLISCDNDDNNTSYSINQKKELDASKIINLNPGNLWIYRSISDNRSGGRDTIEIIEQINKWEMIKGEKFHIIENSYFDDPVFDEYVSIRVDGLYYYDKEADTIVLSMKFPCQKGDYFVYGNSDTVKILSTNEKIIIDNNTYTTIHYYRENKRKDGSLFFSNRYVQPGIGTIKSDSYFVDVDGNISFAGASELILYRFSTK